MANAAVANDWVDVGAQPKAPPTGGDWVDVAAPQPVQRSPAQQTYDNWYNILVGKPTEAYHAAVGEFQKSVAEDAKNLEDVHNAPNAIEYAAGTLQNLPHQLGTALKGVNVVAAPIMAGAGELAKNIVSPGNNDTDQYFADVAAGKTQQEPWYGPHERAAAADYLAQNAVGMAPIPGVAEAGIAKAARAERAAAIDSIAAKEASEAAVSHVGASVMASQTVDDAIASAKQAIDTAPIPVPRPVAPHVVDFEDLPVAAREAVPERQPEALDTTGLKPATAEPVENTATTELPTVRAAEVEDWQPVTSAETPKSAVDLDAEARNTAPEAFREYDNLSARHDTYTRWVNELAEKRANDPRIQAAQTEIDTILGKVHGREQYLTQTQAARLADIRGGIQDFLAVDTPDMVRIKRELADNYSRMRELEPQIKDAYQQAKARNPVEPKSETPPVAEPAQVPNATEEAKQPAAQQASEPRNVTESSQADLGPVTVREAEPQPGTPVPTRAVEPTASAATGPQVIQEIRADDLGTRDKDGFLNINMKEAGATVRKVADEALSNGLNVTLHTEGKTIPITKPGMRDARGMPWGIHSILQPKVGEDAWLEISKPAVEVSEKAPIEIAPKVESAIIPEEVKTPEQSSFVQDVLAPLPPQRAKALKPIEGTGEIRERAINQDLYNVGEEAPQLEAAQRLVTRNPEKAVDIAMRRTPPPAGVHPEFVYMAVENMAKESGDYALQMRLSQSPIATEATTMGQRIAAWRNRDEISPVNDMRKISEARAEGLKLRGVDAVKSQEKEVKVIKSEIRKTASAKRETWEQFISNVTCGY